MKALRTTLIVLFCLVGLWCGLLSVRPPWLEPVPGVRLEPSRPILREADLKPDGAYALLRKACAAAPISSAVYDEVLALVETNAFSPALISGVTSFLEKVRPCLELARQASQAPSPQAVTKLLAGQRIPAVSFARNVVSLFRISALTSAGQGNLDGACRDIEDAVRFSDILSRGGVLIEGLIDASCCCMTADTACRLAQRYSMPEASSRRLQETLLELDVNSEPWAECVRQYRRQCLSGVEAAYRGNSVWFDSVIDHPRPALTVAAFLAPVLGSTYSISSNSFDACFTHLVALADGPYDKRGYERLRIAVVPHDHWLWETLSHRDPVGRILAGFILPEFGMAHLQHEKKHVSLRAAALALAANRFHAAHGRWPAELGELVPDFIAALPDDPFGRGPLLYRADGGGGWIIYSVGPNGVDDGGDGEQDKDVVFPSGR